MFCWDFDMQDVDNNDFEGLYIDQVVLLKVCNEFCFVFLDCFDLGQCMEVFCVQGECKYENLDDCCDMLLDCDDSNSCIMDLCNDQY